MKVLDQIIAKLEKSDLTEKKGKIYLDFDGIKTNITSKDIVGNSLQDWFGEWLKVNNFSWSPGIHSQNWPDFILEDGSHLELKTFNHDASPAFDLANFDAFIRSLYDGNIERIDTPHLVFSYKVNANGYLQITDFWNKFIWELTGPSPTNIIELQVKQGSPINIRPKNWRNPKVNLFENRLSFMKALDQVITKYNRQDRFNGSWLKKVSADYKDLTGSDL